MLRARTVAPLVTQGDALLADGDLDGAEAAYRRAWQRDHNSADAAWSIGCVASRRGDVEATLEWGRRALELDAYHLGAVGLTGSALAALKRHDEAIPYLQTAADGGSETAHAELGLCFEQLGRLPEAEACLRRLLERDVTYNTRRAAIGVYSQSPFWADVHHALARVLQGQGNDDEARLHYHLTKRIDPETVLDSRYLEIMSTEDLEDHPIDALAAEPPDSDAADELTRQIIELGRAGDYDELVRLATDRDREALLSRLAGMIEACQVTGDFTFAARLRPIIDVVGGSDARELHDAVVSSPWLRLLGLAERVAAGRMPAVEAAAAVRADPPDRVRLLLDLVNRFVALDPRSGLVLAALVANALDEQNDAATRAHALRLVGRARLRCGDAIHAEEAFRRALAIAEEDGDDQAADAVLSELWMAQAELADFDGAESSLRRRIAHAVACGDRECELSERDDLASLFLHVGRQTDAYDTALEIAGSVASGAGSGELADHVAATLKTAATAIGRPVPDGLLSRLSERAGGQDSRAGTPASGAQAFIDRGHALAEAGQDVEARDALERGLRRAEHAGTVDTWSALMQLSIVCARAGDPEAALEAAQRALSHAERRGDVHREATSHEHLAQLLSDTRGDRAAHHFGRALELRGAAGEREAGASRALEELAELADGQRSRSEPVDDALLRLQERFDALAEPWERRKGGLILGAAALDARDHERSQRALREVVAIAGKGEYRDAYDEIQARALLGTSYRQTGQHANARDQYVRGIERATAVHDQRAEGDLRGRLGIALRQLGELERALAEYDRAIEIAALHRSHEEVAVHKMNRASVLFELARDAEAIASGLDAWGAFERQGETQMAFRTLMMLKQNAGEGALAGGPIRRLHELLQEDVDEQAEHVMLSYRAVARRDEGDIEGARADLTQALELLRRRGDRVEETRALLNRARVLGDHDPAGAVADVEDALVLALSLGSVELEVDALEVSVDLAFASGRISEAIDRLRELDGRWSALRRRLSRDVDRVALAGRVADGLKRCAVMLLLEGEVEVAVSALELARGAAFGDLLSTTTVEADAPWSDPLDLAPAARLLDDIGPDAIAVGLDILQGQVAVTLLDAAGAARVEPAGMAEAELESLLGDFRLEVIDYRGRAAQTWAPRAAALLGPVAEAIRNAKTIVFVLDGPLHELPLHAVPMPDGRRLIEWASVVYAPSMHALAHLREGASLPADDRSTTITTIGVAFPDEARAISYRTGGECISGRRLDKETVRDFATRGKVLHFACHGFFDGRTPLDSGLLLSTTTPPRPDDVLSIRDVAEWDLHADLVTLSACETGLGQIVPADFLSLARGFMGVGARSVIASLWPVEDAATQRLMLSFYDDIERQRNTFGAVDVAAALRTAQLAWCGAPMHEWAAFKLIGWPMFEWAASA